MSSLLIGINVFFCLPCWYDACYSQAIASCCLLCIQSFKFAVQFVLSCILPLVFRERCFFVIVSLHLILLDTENIGILIVVAFPPVIGLVVNNWLMWCWSFHESWMAGWLWWLCFRQQIASWVTLFLLLLFSTICSFECNWQEVMLSA